MKTDKNHKQRGKNELFYEAIKSISEKLEIDNGGLIVMRFDEKLNVAELALTGECLNCSKNSFTLNVYIVRWIKEKVPWLREVSIFDGKKTHHFKLQK